MKQTPTPALDPNLLQQFNQRIIDALSRTPDNLDPIPTGSRSNLPSASHLPPRTAQFTTPLTRPNDFDPAIAALIFSHALSAVFQSQAPQRPVFDKEWKIPRPPFPPLYEQPLTTQSASAFADFVVNAINNTAARTGLNLTSDQNDNFRATLNEAVLNTDTSTVILGAFNAAKYINENMSHLPPTITFSSIATLFAIATINLLIGPPPDEGTDGPDETPGPYYNDIFPDHSSKLDDFYGFHKWIATAIHTNLPEELIGHWIQSLIDQRKTFSDDPDISIGYIVSFIMSHDFWLNASILIHGIDTRYLENVFFCLSVKTIA